MQSLLSVKLASYHTAVGICYFSSKIRKPKKWNFPCEVSWQETTHYNLHVFVQLSFFRNKRRCYNVPEM